MRFTLIKKLSPRASTRKKAHWHSVKQTAKKHGFELYKSNLTWPTEPAFARLQELWPKTRGMSNHRRFFLFNTARRVRHLAGDSADVGVRFGTSSFFILSGLDDPSKRHHLFDSFEGLSEPAPEDAPAGAGPSVWKKGDLRVGEEVTRANLAQFANCSFHKGWIPERFPDVERSRFCFVHIDVDLYQPTLDSLKFFYDRVVPGGVIVCDDYGFTSCPGAMRALEEFFAGRKEALFHIPTGQALVVKQ
jgi:hypothetical protein